MATQENVRWFNWQWSMVYIANTLLLKFETKRLWLVVKVYFSDFVLLTQKSILYLFIYFLPMKQGNACMADELSFWAILT
jgi:hypothetical protein